jgi:hypothetical protein
LDTLRSLQPGEILYMGAPPVRVDLFTAIPGVEFESAWANRVETVWDGTEAKVIGIKDLLLAKRASGRPQDLVDIKTLERLSKR